MKIRTYHDLYCYEVKNHPKAGDLIFSIGPQKHFKVLSHSITQGENGEKFVALEADEIPEVNKKVHPAHTTYMGASTEVITWE